MTSVKTAFVDDRLAAREFATGDTVRKAGIRDFVLTPYAGRVLYSNPETGKVSVQWPWGTEQESATELVKWGAHDYLAPQFMDQSVSTWESARHTHDDASNKADKEFRKSIAARVADRHVARTRAARIVAKYEERTLPIWRAACSLWHSKLSEIEAFRRLSSNFEDEFGQDAVRITVANLYELGRRIALYWNPERKYRVTQKEKSSGRVHCPRCKDRLKPRVYTQGQRVLQCRSCGFTILPGDLC